MIDLKQFAQDADNEHQRQAEDDMVQALAGTTHITIPAPKGWKCGHKGCMTEFIHEHSTYSSLAMNKTGVYTITRTIQKGWTKGKLLSLGMVKDHFNTDEDTAYGLLCALDTFGFIKPVKE